MQAYKLGKYEDAIEFYARAYEAEPSAIEIGIRYVQAVIKTNQVERARRIVKSLKTTDPKLQEKIYLPTNFNVTILNNFLLH